MADHWTWHSGKPSVTGWHYPPKRGRKAEPEPEPIVARGVVTVSTGHSKQQRERQGQLL